MNLDDMKRIKKEKGFSMQYISDKSGIALGTIRKIFTGITRIPRYGTLKQLERFFKEEDGNIPIGAFFQRYNAYGADMMDPHQNNYTIADYYDIPDDQRVEIIDGVLYDMAAPGTIHQMIITMMVSTISEYIRSKKGKCLVLPAPTDVRLDYKGEDKTMVQPDILILCDRKKLSKKCILGAPDFVMEILSPSTSKKDKLLKTTKYSNAGVREYWMIDPEKKVAIIYNFEKDEGPSIYPLTEKIPVNIYNGDLVIDLSSTDSMIDEFSSLPS